MVHVLQFMEMVLLSVFRTAVYEQVSLSIVFLPQTIIYKQNI